LDKQTEILLAQGKMLPLMEAFYSIQGEGYNTGMASFFVRVGGCDVGCHWCDVKESWNANLHPPTLTDDIIKQVETCPAKAVIVTGGEPLNYNFDYFCAAMKERGIKTYLESSGSNQLSGKWDWLVLSPKKNKPPVEEIYAYANELKIIVSDASDFAWAEENAKKVSSECLLYLQPEWSKADEMMQSIVDYVLAHPRWQISIQSHKYMRIP
jgi:organic radical activating enzyme